MDAMMRFYWLSRAWSRESLYCIFRFCWEFRISLGSTTNCCCLIDSLRRFDWVGFIMVFFYCCGVEEVFSSVGTLYP
jgi:hypothetical protein